ncbi:hypothetical protein SprV_0802515100 [Sparganum proliferum]
MVAHLHDGMVAHITDTGAVSEAYAAKNGVKPDYLLAPKLFSLTLFTLVMATCFDERPGFRTFFRTGRYLLSSRRRQAGLNAPLHGYRPRPAEGCLLDITTEEDT